MNNQLALYCLFLKSLSDIMRDIQGEDDESIDFIEKELEDLDFTIQQLNLTILLESWGKNNQKEYLN